MSGGVGGFRGSRGFFDVYGVLDLEVGTIGAELGLAGQRVGTDGQVVADYFRGEAEVGVGVWQVATNVDAGGGNLVAEDISVVLDVVEFGGAGEVAQTFGKLGTDHDVGFGGGAGVLEGQLEVDFVANLGGNLLAPGFAVFGEANFLAQGAAGRAGFGVVGDGTDADGNVAGVLITAGDSAVHGGIADDGATAAGDFVAELATAVLADTVVFQKGGALDVFDTEGFLTDELRAAPVLAVKGILGEDVAGDGVRAGGAFGKVEGNADV